ncbi:MAG TPA: MarR family winged helix-turn-helix transcriptional regulator [Gemmatimonadales bacterium]|nr:MarR family winged helix-turn-helix transcriptional regulator [Gemmatimonadales bacterium]
MSSGPAPHLAFGLARLAALARQESWRAGEEHGLTPTQADILDLLARRTAGLRLGQLAELLHITQPTTSDAVAALVRKKLVRRLADPSDGRVTLLRATAGGLRLAERWPESFAAVVEAMSAEDRASMLAIVMRTIAGLVEAGTITPQRMCLSCRFFAPDTHPGSSKPHHCGYLDTPLGAGDLRTDCPEFQELDAA